MTTFISAYADKLGGFIQSRACLDSGAASSQFGTMALELFARQFECNPAYRRLCLAQGATPETVSDWSAIPAAPTSAFKELELTCLRPSEHKAVFHSSGTTEQRPSRHFHSAESLAVYERSLRAWFAPHLLAEETEKVRILCLTPTPEAAPHSSLAHMFETVRRSFGDGDSFFAGVIADGAWALDFGRLLAALDDSERTSQPVALLGTAFNFVHLLDELAERGKRFQLPPGSRVMETGGYKGRSRVLEKTQLHQLVEEFLGIPRSRIVCEYGMSELSSQAYDHSLASDGDPMGSALERYVTPDAAPAARPFRFPPWARFLVMSPETGKPAPEGQPGLLRVFDLANVASVLAIQTGDLAVQRGDGFELLGRAALSEPRGCSLMSAQS